MDNTFVRKDFYLDPPAKDAAPEVWAVWIEAEATKARVAKAAFTRSQKRTYSASDMPEMGLAKIGGRWVQCVRIGLGGEDGNVTREQVVDATQESDLESARRMEEVAHRRGGSRKSRNAHRRAKTRMQRKSRYC